MYKTKRAKENSTKAFVRPFGNPEKLLGIYKLVEEFIRANGYPPTCMEMVRAGVSPSSSVVHYFFQRMVEEGMMEITPKIARGIRLLPLGEASERVQGLLSITRQDKP